jgi:hypothetical protein
MWRLRKNKTCRLVAQQAFDEPAYDQSSKHRLLTRRPHQELKTLVVKSSNLRPYSSAFTVLSLHCHKNNRKSNQIHFVGTSYPHVTHRIMENRFDNMGELLFHVVVL